VGLAAVEGGLQANHGVATVAREPFLQHLLQPPCHERPGGMGPRRARASKRTCRRRNRVPAAGGNGLGGNLGRDAEGGSSGLELVVDEGSDADRGLAVHGLGDRLDRLEVGDGIRGSTINSSSRDYRFAVIDPGVYFRAVSNSRGMS